MGLPSRVDGTLGQTLLNTSSSGYMNPLPRGEKVNGPGGTAGATEPGDTPHI